MGLFNNLGPVVRSLVSANRWLRGPKTYRFPWYLTLVSANHASSNPGLANKFNPVTCCFIFVYKMLTSLFPFSTYWCVSFGGIYLAFMQTWLYSLNMFH